MTTSCCYVCGASAPLERHHIIPGWALTVGLCVRCHREQTRQQWANRTLPQHDDQAHALWNVIHGVLGLAIACADDMDRSALQRAQRVALRMLCEITAVDLGPNPTGVLPRGVLSTEKAAS